eukprot:1905124-Prymnesium_polylepis.1
MHAAVWCYPTGEPTGRRRRRRSPHRHASHRTASTLPAGRYRTAGWCKPLEHHQGHRQCQHLTACTLTARTRRSRTTVSSNPTRLCNARCRSTARPTPHQPCAPRHKSARHRNQRRLRAEQSRSNWRRSASHCQQCRTVGRASYSAATLPGADSGTVPAGRSEWGGADPSRRVGCSARNRIGCSDHPLCA